MFRTSWCLILLLCTRHFLGPLPAAPDVPRTCACVHACIHPTHILPVHLQTYPHARALHTFPHTLTRTQTPHSTCNVHVTLTPTPKPTPSRSHSCVLFSQKSLFPMGLHGPGSRYPSVNACGLIKPPEERVICLQSRSKAGSPEGQWDRSPPKGLDHFLHWGGFLTVAMTRTQLLVTHGQPAWVRGLPGPRSATGA